MFQFRTTVFTFLLLLLAACSTDKSSSKFPEFTGSAEPALMAENPIMKLLSPEESGVGFQNKIVETFDDNIMNNIFIYNGGGVGIGDFNNDGLQDVYFVSTFGENALYINKGDMKFEDIAKSAGVESSDGFEAAVTIADVNADGLQDIYISRSGRPKGEIRCNKLFINQGNTAGQITFKEEAKAYGLDAICQTSGATFFDYDLDGDLDCYIVNYPSSDAYTTKIESFLGTDGKYHPNTKPKEAFDSDRLYRNDTKNGKTTFTNVSKEAGIENFAYGLSVSITDFNQDGYPDIYVGNDFIHPDFMYINNKNGTFTDKLTSAVKHTSQHTMGVDINDVDNDGLVDIFAVDMLPEHNYRQKTVQTSNTLSRYTALLQAGYFEPIVRNVLQKNNGDGTYHDRACAAGVSATDWSWSSLLFDMDNDGLRDLHITNGYRREIVRYDVTTYVIPEVIEKYQKGQRLEDQFETIDDFLQKIDTFRTRNYCFRNKGNADFENVGGDWMAIIPSWSSGAAWADFDNDGDLDLAVNNMDDPAFIFQNQAAQNLKNNNYLQIKFEGNAINPFGIGASVGIYRGSSFQTYENNTNRGIFSSVEPLAHFGLGNNKAPVRVVVRWPDGSAQSLNNVPLNQRLTLKQSDASTSTFFPTVPMPKVANPILNQKNPNEYGLNFIHKENDFNDFEAWPMHPWGITELGPFVSKGDVNRDGLEDFFVGGGANQASALFIQNKNGKFIKTSPAAFEADAAFEDHGSCFFDADLDGDLDLVVASGGAEAKSDNAWSLRMYTNENGDFKRVVGSVFPALKDIPSKILAGDFDQDGDNDLLIAGRSKQGDMWPTTPRSLYLRNDRKKFTDVTVEMAPAFEYCGMVTDMVFANIDADPKPEILVSGEMMPIRAFKIEEGKLNEITSTIGLENSHGLWNCIQPTDVDRDGDIDFIAGNFGLNSRLRASEEAPIECWAADFDDNRTLDPVLSLTINGEPYPLMQRPVLVKQMPFLNKKYLYAKDYAEATIHDIFPKEKIESCNRLKVNTLETSVFIQENGKFIRHPLPVQAQLAPTFGITVADFNSDRVPDILVVGNKHKVEVETGACNNSMGATFIGDGKGNFIWADNRVTGFWAKNEARAITPLRIGTTGKGIFVVANNNGALEVFE